MVVRKITLFVLLVSGVAYAQPDSLWSRLYGGEHHDRCREVVLTSDGGYALGGFYDNFRVTGYDFYLVKTDNDGTEQWSRTYGSDEDFYDSCNSLIQTTDGGFLLTGTTCSFGVGGDDGWLVKTDSTGDSLWSHTFGGRSNDYFLSLIQTSDGGYAMGGLTGSFAVGGAWDFYLVKVDEEGEELWHRAFGGRSGDKCYSLIQTNDGGYLCAGSTTSFGDGDFDIYIVKTDSSGDEEWSRAYGSHLDETCASAIQTPDGGYAFAGTEGIFDHNETYSFYLVRTNADGDSLWSRSYGGNSRDYCLSLIQTEDGGFVLAGFTHSFGAGSDDFYLVRTDSDGEELWSRTFGTRYMERCSSVIGTPDGGYALAGTRFIPQGPSDQLWLVKTGPDPLNIIALTDPSYPSDIIFLSPFPNPFNSSTTISYRIPNREHVTLRIFDLSGREVAVLSEGVVNPGLHSVIWNGQGQPSGVYLCRFEAGSRVLINSLTLIR